MIIISSADTWCEQKKKQKKKFYAMKTSMLMCNYYYIYVAQPNFYSLGLRPLNCAPFKAAVLILFWKKKNKQQKLVLPGWSNFLLFTCLQVANCHLFITVLFCVREDIKRAFKITVDWNHPGGCSVQVEFDENGWMLTLCLYFSKRNPFTRCLLAFSHPLWSR